MNVLRCPTCGRQYPPGFQACPEDGTPLQADATVAAPDMADAVQPAGAVSDTKHKTAADALVGTVLDGKYRLDRPLGVGGMGTVFRATHLLIERPVAVKVLNPRLVTDEAAQERLRREARAAGRLRHTNAVAVTDFGQTSDGIMYVVMELLEGVTLREFLAGRVAPLDASEAVSIMLQVSAAVAAAHEAGIIHRDLKPGNVFILERSHNTPIVKVLDFGIAKVAAHEEEDGRDGSMNEVAAAMTLTETGVMIGTPRYMSPEQCDGMKLTPASDVYSLGIILYEMLTGAPPFNGPTPLSVALKHSAEPPRPLREIVPETHPDLEGVVLHALAKRPEERPSDAGGFRRELNRVAEELGLIHASGFSVPTAEMLREAGTETPSGRLVIDIERLRESRPTIGGEGSAPVTAENPAPFDTGAVGRPASIESAAGLTTVVAPFGRDVAAANAPGRAGRAGGILNTVESVRQQFARTWAQRPAVVVGGGVAALIVGVLLITSLVRLASSGGAATADPSSLSAVDSSEPQAQVAQADRRGGAVAVREPQTANDFYERSGDLFAQRDYAAAERDLRRALELQPAFPEAHNRLGRALVQQGKFTAAVAEFRRAVEGRGGDFAIANFNLGDALERTGDHREAISAYEAAIANRGGGYPGAHFEIGRIHFNRGRNREAAVSFRQVISAGSERDPETHYYLGIALARESDFAAAEPALRTAIEQRDGNYPEAHYALGLLYENTDRPADAVRAYETYLQQQPDAVNRRAVENALRNLRRRAAAESVQPSPAQ